MKLPFKPTAEVCYKKLKETDAVMQTSFEKLKSIAQQNLPFSEKIATFTAEYLSTMELSQTMIQHTPWKQEDVFRCCALDIMLALFTSEAHSIIKSTQALDEKKQAFRNLKQDLDVMPTSSPQWREVDKPRFLKAIAEVEAKLKQSVAFPANEGSLITERTGILKVV